MMILGMTGFTSGRMRFMGKNICPLRKGLKLGFIT